VPADHNRTPKYRIPRDHVAAVKTWEAFNILFFQLLA
jgi:hypothetical protein